MGEPPSSPANSPHCHCRASIQSGSYTAARMPASIVWSRVRGSSRCQVRIGLGELKVEGWQEVAERQQRVEIDGPRLGQVERLVQDSG